MGWVGLGWVGLGWVGLGRISFLCRAMLLQNIFTQLFNFLIIFLLSGLGECHDVNSLFSGGCPANSYITTKIATLQTIIDAAITKVIAGKM